MSSFPYELAQLISHEQQKTTLWMGELEPWMDEQYIQQLWFNLNEKVMVKVIRDKITGISAGYAFVDFGTAASARLVMNNFNGVLMPNSSKHFKLNWASGGGLIDRREDRQPEYSIFVGDLSPEITEIDLLAVFQSRYLSCKSAKIMTDPRTGLTRGYGFVRFAEQLDQQRALIEMQGYFIGSRAIRVSVATPKNRTTSQQQQPFMINTAISTPTTASSLMTSPNKSPLLQQQSPLLLNDATNTTVFVGGLSAPIREDELRQYFQHFGEIVYVKIPPGKGCGFVQYVSRSSAELAIQQMNGYQIGNSRIRLSWGRSQNEKSVSPTMMDMLGGNILSSPTTLPRPLSSSSLYNTYSTFSSISSPPMDQRHLMKPEQPIYSQQQPLFPSIHQQPQYPTSLHHPQFQQPQFQQPQFQQPQFQQPQFQQPQFQQPQYSNTSSQHPIQQPQGYSNDLKFLSNDDSDDLFASVTRSLMDNNNNQGNSRAKNVDWRLNQIYAQ